MKSIKDEVLAKICEANLVKPNDVVCILDAYVKIISEYWYYGFYVRSKELYCFYWSDRSEIVFPEDIVYFTNYTSYCKHVNVRLKH